MRDTPERILVIDDNRAIHEDFRKILAPEASPTNELDSLESELFGGSDPGVQRRSYAIDSAYQGEEGWQMVRRAVESGNHYSLAFVDMRMPPGWDGLMTIDKIWQADPDIQIVICSAYSDYSWEDIFKKFGSGDRLLILKKPFDTAEVCQLACALTEKWHLARHAHLKLSQLRAMVQEQTRDLEAANRRLIEEVEQRKRSESRYYLAATGANDGLWDWDLVTDTIYYSPRWKESLGYGDAQIGDRPDEWMSRVHADDLPSLRGALQDHYNGKADHIDCEFRMLHRDGQYRWMLCRGTAVMDEEGRPIRSAGSLTDITDRRMAEEQLRFEAMHDALTGLANRTLLTDRLTRCIARAKRDADFRFAVLYLDLDHFKVINDSLGHLTGDKLLIGIARRLADCARQVDTVSRVEADHVARIGGDEFVILLEGLSDPGDALLVAKRIQSVLDEPFHIDGHELFSYASVGIATGAMQYERAEDVLRDADTALYRAKEAGKRCTRVFDPEMHQRAMARWLTENELRRAIDGDEIVLHYQPIVSGEGRLIALEALARWQHPTRGLTPPDQFIPIAEETGLIVPLGRRVMAAACRQLRRWQTQYPALAELTVAVNVSSKQLALPGFVDDVADVLLDSGLAPHCLTLEITETAAMHHVEQTLETLTRLHDMGVRIYMDDFGTGYSSLSHLHRMPIDAMKIDRGFVATMDSEPMSRSIVLAVTTIAHSMRMRVIAEGVETAPQLDELRRMGGDCFQGYLFSRPLPAEAATEYLGNECAQGLRASA